MATEPVLAVFQLTALQRRHSVRSRALSDYWELTKPEVNFLIAMTTVAAFCLGSPKPFVHFPWFLLLSTLLGTVLVASGAGALNGVNETSTAVIPRRT
jgi:heme O synthase-like polyprenyltransferase